MQSFNWQQLNYTLHMGLEKWYGIYMINGFMGYVFTPMHEL